MEMSGTVIPNRTVEGEPEWATSYSTTAGKQCPAPQWGAQHAAEPPGPTASQPGPTHPLFVPPTHFPKWDD